MPHQIQLPLDGLGSRGRFRIVACVSLLIVASHSLSPHHDAITNPGRSSNKLINSTYTLHNMQTYFTAGPKEVRAWTIPIGFTAPQAAGVIHTDFEKGFIKAEIISYFDYVNYGSELKAKEAGKMRSEGKSYIVNDGDIVHFLFNV